jgi:quinol monooxygenase YgiN
MDRMPFVVIAKFTAKSGMEDRLRAVLEVLVAPTRLEAGCLHYELVQAQADARRFTFYEKWESEEALASHTRTAHVHRARQERVPLLDGPADVTRWDVVG